MRPLWPTPNTYPGRFHDTGTARVPTQYFCLHSMGPLSELLRSDPYARRHPSSVMRNVFALRLRVDDILHVTFATANSAGISPDALVDDDWTRCQTWAAKIRGMAVAGLRVPSAALPGTENLILFGARYPIGFNSTPRRPEMYLPCSVVSLGGYSHAELASAVHPRGASTLHPALSSHLAAGSPYTWTQANPSG